MSGSGHAVVIVSGGDAISPFTTPSDSAREGLPAGSTDTALREALLDAGFTVFTSPATAGPGTAEADSGFGGFREPPIVLPEEMTVNAVGPIDDAGASLATFLAWLRIEHSITSLDLIGHSMGGLFSRAAIRELQQDATPLVIRSLVTIGTPWQGSFAADYANGHMTLDAAGGDAGTASIMTAFADLRRTASTGAGEQVTRAFLDGAEGWNEQQGGVLDAIPVTVIGGDYFQQAGGDPAVWPHDGLVALSSALAEGVSADVLPQPTALTFTDVHSIFLADQFGLPWDRALTWDPAVLDTVIRTLTR